MHNALAVYFVVFSRTAVARASRDVAACLMQTFFSDRCRRRLTTTTTMTQTLMMMMTTSVALLLASSQVASTCCSRRQLSFAIVFRAIAR